MKVKQIDTGTCLWETIRDEYCGASENTRAISTNLGSITQQSNCGASLIKIASQSKELDIDKGNLWTIAIFEK